MPGSQISLVSALAAPAAPEPKKPTKLGEAAQQFESLLIGEMLKTARESSDDGWLGGGSDSAAESAFGVAETQFAQAISSHGGLGLARTIERSLAPHLSGNHQKE